MTSDAEIRALIERLRQYEGRNWENTLCYNGVRDEAATALSALLEERNKAREYGGQARIRENKAEDARISAQTRITDLEQKLAKAREALEPFSRAADVFEVTPDENGFYWGGNEQNARITTWFGPSDFGIARSTLEALK